MNYTVFLLQIAMMSSGTHISCEKSWVPVQNQWVPANRKWVQNGQCLGLYVTRYINLKTHSKTLYFSILKLKYSSSFLKPKSTKAKRNMCRQTTTITATEITSTGYFYKYTRSDRSIHELFLRLWGFLCVRNVGLRGNKITDYIAALFMRQERRT